jgi:hypothetical protein
MPPKKDEKVSQAEMKAFSKQIPHLKKPEEKHKDLEKIFNKKKNKK